MTDHIYYNYEIQNNSQNILVADKVDRRLSELINNPSEYAISIVKFSLPTEAIKSFIINNSSDYLIKYGSPAGLSLFNSQVNIVNYNAQNGLPTNDNFSYISYEDFIESFNRTSMLTYRDYLNSFSSNPLSFNNKLNFANTFNFSVNSAPYVYEQTIAVNSGIFNSVDNKLGYIKLTLNVGYTGSETGLSPGLRHPHRLYLIDPSGTNKCLIYSNFDCDYNNTITFEDSALKSLDSLQDYTLPIPSGVYQPKESFLKFNTTNSQFGNWKLRFESTSCESSGVHNFHLNVNYNLEMSFLPKQENGNSLGISQYPILLGLNDTNTNLLQLKVHESWYYGNNYISFSPKLNSILGFPTYLGSDGFYKLKQPQVLLSTTMSASTFIDYVQPVSTLYKLTNIKAIQLRSNTIPVSGEFSLASQSNILMSINVSVDTAKDIYEFSATIERFYDLIGNEPLTDIHFSVWVEYVDGSVIQAYLPPYSSFTMLAKFVNKYKISN